MLNFRLDSLARLPHAITNRRSAVSLLIAALSAAPSRGFTAVALSKGRGKKKKRKKHTCQSPQRRCGRSCRNLQRDPQHCGSCNARCSSGETCIDGACQEPFCPAACSTSSCGEFPLSCLLFPANNIWNTPIDDLEPDDNSDDFVERIGLDTGLHADFGAGEYDGGPIGIPFVTVPGSQPEVSIAFTEYGDESDPGPYPIPPDAPIEGGQCRAGDRHVLVVESGFCKLYELYHARPNQDGSWSAGSGARYDLTSNDLRTAGWTSADAAGLPILPGLVRYEEVEAGEITHALRFTAETTRREYVWPARHHAGSTDSTDVPPMGQRFRLKEEFDISSFSQDNQVILTALKRYGMILADNGSDWFLSGVPDERWDNDDLHELQERVHGRHFEAVDATSLMIDPDSGEAQQ